MFEDEIDLVGGGVVVELKQARFRRCRVIITERRFLNRQS